MDKNGHPKFTMFVEVRVVSFSRPIHTVKALFVVQGNDSTTTALNRSSGKIADEMKYD